jgi:hypothetical protein
MLEQRVETVEEFRIVLGGKFPQIVPCTKDIRSDAPEHDHSD